MAAVHQVFQGGLHRLKLPELFVQLLDVVEHDSVLYQVMEWIDGESLSTVLDTANKRGGAIPQVPPDYVGVYVRLEHGYVTGVLGDSVTITDGSINLLEPQG